MTTIVCRQGVIAADSLITSGGAQFAFSNKIVKRGSALAGACGASVLCRLFYDWFLSGMKGAPPKMRVDKDTSATGVIHYAPFRFLTLDEDGLNDLEGPFFALGSGARFAKGALFAGASAVDAVRAAIEFDCYSGGEVRALHAKAPRDYADFSGRAMVDPSAAPTRLVNADLTLDSLVVGDFPWAPAEPLPRYVAGR